MKSFIYPIGFLIGLSIFAACLSAFGMPPVEESLSYVPGGKVVRVKDKEIQVLTPNKTIVEIEFHRNGDFEEASGKQAERDIFFPSNGLMPLSKIVPIIRKNGRIPSGEWTLEKSFLRGWVYEFECISKGRKTDYLVNASSGEFISETLDD